MDYYQDIRVLADAETADHVVMAQLFQRLHQYLQRAADGRIGISFPEVKLMLGNRLRLHGSQKDLSALQQCDWQHGLKDYIHCDVISRVPEKKSWRTVRRVQVKSSAERLRRRSVKKGWLSESEAQQRINAINEQRSDLPFLFIKSGSNGNAYPFFIEHGPVVSAPIPGEFSSYGLSATTPIPWF